MARKAESAGICAKEASPRRAKRSFRSILEPLARFKRDGPGSWAFRSGGGKRG